MMSRFFKSKKDGRTIDELTDTLLNLQNEVNSEQSAPENSANEQPQPQNETTTISLDETIKTVNNTISIVKMLKTTLFNTTTLVYVILTYLINNLLLPAAKAACFGSEVAVKYTTIIIDFFKFIPSYLMYIYTNTFEFVLENFVVLAIIVYIVVCMVYKKKELERDVALAVNNNSETIRPLKVNTAWQNVSVVINHIKSFKVLFLNRNTGIDQIQNQNKEIKQETSNIIIFINSQDRFKLKSFYL